MRLKPTVLLGTLVVAAFLILAHTHASYSAQDRDAIAAGVSRIHLAGTDELGRDRAVRISAALLLGLAGSCAASAFASLLAVALGAGAAFSPRPVARTLIYLGDLFLTLPWLFLLMLVRSALPLNMPSAQSAAITFLLLAILGAPTFLRINYERTSSVRSADWYLQARAFGLRPLQMVRQLLPHLRPLVLTQFVLYVPACLIAEANLGTLGLGISEPLPSWGSMIGNIQSAAMLNSSRLIYLPVILLVVVLVALELLVFEVEV